MSNKSITSHTLAWVKKTKFDFVGEASSDKICEYIKKDIPYPVCVVLDEKENNLYSIVSGEEIIKALIEYPANEDEKDYEVAFIVYRGIDKEEVDMIKNAIPAEVIIGMNTEFINKEIEVTREVIKESKTAKKTKKLPISDKERSDQMTKILKDLVEETIVDEYEDKSVKFTKPLYDGVRFTASIGISKHKVASFEVVNPNGKNPKVKINWLLNRQETLATKAAAYLDYYGIEYGESNLIETYLVVQAQKYIDNN